MGTLADYRKCWGAFKVEAEAAYSAYDKQMAAVETMRGSQEWEIRHAKASESYNARMSAARDAFSKKVNGILQRMMDNAERSQSAGIPPNDEQLRMLQALELVESLDMETYLQAKKLMGHNVIANRALHDVAARKMPGVKLAEYKDGESSAREQVKEMARMAQRLIRWDGGTGRGDALSAHFGSKDTPEGWSGLPTDTSRMAESAWAASLDSAGADFYKELLGVMLYDGDALELVD